MNLKTRLKSVSFWTTLAGAILMILRAFGIEMGGTEIETAISSIASVLVFSGILIGDKKTTASSPDAVSQDGEAGSETVEEVLTEAANETANEESEETDCEGQSKAEYAVAAEIEKEQEKN